MCVQDLILSTNGGLKSSKMMSEIYGRKGRKMTVLEKIFMVELKTCGFKVVPEYRFHPTRRWRFDFAIPEEKVAVEVEGGVWTGGRHTDGSGFVKDMEKYNEATMRGWAVLRVQPKNLLTIIHTVRETISNKHKK